MAAASSNVTANYSNAYAQRAAPIANHAPRDTSWNLNRDTRHQIPDYDKQSSQSFDDREQRRESWKQHISTPSKFSNHSVGSSGEREEGEISSDAGGRPSSVSKSAIKVHPSRAAMVPSEPAMRPPRSLPTPTPQERYHPNGASKTPAPSGEVMQVRTPYKDDAGTQPQTPIDSPLDSLDKLRRFKEQVAASRKSIAAPEMEPAKLAAMAETFLKSQKPLSNGHNTDAASSDVSVSAVSTPIKREQELKEKLRARQNGSDAGASPLSGIKRNGATPSSTDKSEKKRPRAEDYNDEKSASVQTQSHEEDSKKLRMDGVEKRQARPSHLNLGHRPSSSKEYDDDGYDEDGHHWTERPVQIPDTASLPAKPQVTPSRSATGRPPWEGRSSEASTPARASHPKVGTVPPSGPRSSALPVVHREPARKSVTEYETPIKRETSRYDSPPRKTQALPQERHTDERRRDEREVSVPDAHTRSVHSVSRKPVLDPRYEVQDTSRDRVPEYAIARNSYGRRDSREREVVRERDGYSERDVKPERYDKPETRPYHYDAMPVPSHREERLYESERAPPTYDHRTEKERYHEYPTREEQYSERRAPREVEVRYETRPAPSILNPGLSAVDALAVKRSIEALEAQVALLKQSIVPGTLTAAPPPPVERYDDPYERDRGRQVELRAQGPPSGPRRSRSPVTTYETDRAGRYSYETARPPSPLAPASQHYAVPTEYPRQYEPAPPRRLSLKDRISPRRHDPHASSRARSPPKRPAPSPAPAPDTRGRDAYASHAPAAATHTSTGRLPDHDYYREGERSHQYSSTAGRSRSNSMHSPSRPVTHSPTQPTARLEPVYYNNKDPSLRDGYYEGKRGYNSDWGRSAAVARAPTSAPAPPPPVAPSYRASANQRRPSSTADHVHGSSSARYGNTTTAAVSMSSGSGRGRSTGGSRGGRGGSVGGGGGGGSAGRRGGAARGGRGARR